MGAIYDLKPPKMALISEYLSADASVDALCIINIGYLPAILEVLLKFV